MNSLTHIMSFCHSCIKLMHKQVNWEAEETHSWPNINSPTGMKQHLPSHSTTSGMCRPVPPGERQLSQCSPLPFRRSPAHLFLSGPANSSFCFWLAVNQRRSEHPQYSLVSMAPKLWASMVPEVCVWLGENLPQSSSWPHQPIIIMSNHPQLQN